MGEEVHPYFRPLRRHTLFILASTRQQLRLRIHALMNPNTPLTRPATPSLGVADADRQRRSVRSHTAQIAFVSTPPSQPPHGTDSQSTVVVYSPHTPTPVLGNAQCSVPATAATRCFRIIHVQPPLVPFVADLLHVVAKHR